MSVSAYDKFIIESAEQYLQTVVLIDDNIYQSKSGQVASRLEKPPAVSRKPAVKSKTNKSEGTIEKKEVSEKPDEVSFHDVQNSFAKQRIICSLYQPQKTASFSEQSEVYKLCSTADVVIVDWDLHGDSGVNATTLVGNLVEKSQVEIPYQLRLVLIYTLEVNLRSVADNIFNDLVARIGDDYVDADTQTQGLVITTENARVVILGKRTNTSLTQFKDFWVPEKDLASRTIMEFSLLASGLLQGIVLRGMATLRINNRRILTRYKDLDGAFLTHRALLLPDEAFGQITPMLTDELCAVLEDTLGEYPLGKASSCKRILNDWCSKHWKNNKAATLNIGDGANGLEFVKDVFGSGPSLNKSKYQGRGSKVEGLIKERENEKPLWKEDKFEILAEYLLGDCEIDHCHEKLGSLMSQRIKYDKSQKELHLGVIVKELSGSKRFLLCLQPVCDSVRMNGNVRIFVFCELEASVNGKFTHCVIDDSGKVIRLKFKPNVPSLFVFNFKSDGNTVCATKDNKGRFIFRDESKKRYEWIAELKTEHAQRAAEQFGRELSRVGLIESEWLRLKAK